MNQKDIELINTIIYTYIDLVHTCIDNMLFIVSTHGFDSILLRP